MAKPGETSIWKKEITLRRKPKAEQAAAGPKPAPKATPGPTPGLVPSPVPKAEPTSIWKKEISFRRRKGDRPAEAPRSTTRPAGRAAKPESVAELLGPLVEQPLDPVVLPPVTPLAARPVAPPQSPLAQPPIAPPPIAPPVERAEPGPPPQASPAEESAQPVPLPEHDRERPEPRLGPGPEQHPESRSEPPAEPRPELRLQVVPGETMVELPPPLPEVEPEPEPEPQRPLTRRERRAAKQEAQRLAKEQRKRAKALAKEAPALHKRVVGLKVGGSQIAAAQVINKGGPRIVRMARAPLPRGVVVGGELRQPDELAAAMKTLFRKNKLPRNCVRLGISNNRIGVRTFEVSGIEDRKQLANAIRFRAQETLPIPLDEAVLDYRILEERIGEDGVTTHRVLLVVAHRELVDRYVAACRRAGLKLVGIDLEAFALLRALGDPTAQPAAEDAGLVCVSIGYDRSTLAVSDGQVCEFTRVLAWGGSALDAAVARVLDVEPVEAEPARLALALDEEGEAAGLDAELAREARRAMVAELQVFARELIASLRFYQEQPGSLGIGEILVTGGTAACGGLAAELERLIGVRVRVADPLARAKLPRKAQKGKDASSGSLAIAVGLGIED